MGFSKKGWGYPVSIAAVAVAFFAGTKFNWNQWQAKEPAKSSGVSREVASTFTVDETVDIPNDMREFKKNFQAMKTTSDFQVLVDNLEKNYSKSSQPLKMVTLQLNVFPVFRSFIYSSEKMFSLGRSTRSMTISSIKKIAGRLDLITTGKEWNIIYDYLVNPYVADGNLPSQFGSEVEMQDYICTSLYDKLKDNGKKFDELYAKMKRPLVIDNRIFAGEGAFKDDLGRYSVLNYPELMLYRVGIESALGNLSSGCAYSMEGAVAVSKKLGTLFGIDVINLLAVPDGVSNEQKVTAIRSVPSFLKLRKGGEELMKRSWGHYVESVNLLEKAWLALQKYPDSDYSLYSRDRVLDQKEDIEKQLQYAKDMVNKPYITLRSHATGRVIQVNIKDFYMKPESDLKKFLAIGWVKGQDTVRAQLPGSKKPYTYKNYRNGNPTKWDNDVWGKYVKTDESFNGDIFLETYRTSQMSFYGRRLASIIDLTML